MKMFSKKPAALENSYVSIDQHSPTNPLADDSSRSPSSRSRAILRACVKGFPKPAPKPEPDRMLLSAMVSARATRAEEFIGKETLPTGVSASYWLAANGLSCTTNPGQNEWMSFAQAMIQHATGYYGPFKGPEAKLQPALSEKIDKLITLIDNSVRDGSMRDNQPILAEINKAFPRANLAVTVLNGDSGTGAASCRPIMNDNASKGFVQNNVLILWKGNRFEAVIADHAVMEKRSSVATREQKTPFFDAHFIRAEKAAVELTELLTTDEAKERPDHEQTASLDNPLETDEASLNMRFMSANIERIANDAPQDISFITGLLRHATGICNKQDLPASTQQLVTADEPLHALEARILLNTVNETGTAEDRARPIGSFENDLRISKVIELINQRHGVELNLQLLEIRESGLNNAGIYSEMPGASKQLDQPSDTATTFAMLRNGTSFEPLRKSAIRTNPALQPMERRLRKSLFGKSITVADNMFSWNRNAAKRMSDDELFAQNAILSGSHSKRFAKAVSNELNKRQDIDRFDKGTQTLAERIKCGFRQPSHAENPYAERSAADLSRILRDNRARPLLIRSEKRLIKMAFKQKMIEMNSPVDMESTRATLKPLANDRDIGLINIGFKDLIRTVDAEAVAENWATDRVDTWTSGSLPWGDESNLSALENTVLHAWQISQQAFILGKPADLETAARHLHAARDKFAALQMNPGIQRDLNGFKQFVTAGAKIDILLRQLEVIKSANTVDPRDSGLRAFKQRERLENGLKPPEVVALADIASRKLALARRQNQLQRQVNVLRKDLRFIEILEKNHSISPSHDDATASKVIASAKAISSSIKNTLSIRTQERSELAVLKDELAALKVGVNLCLCEGNDRETLERKTDASWNLLVEGLSNNDRDRLGERSMANLNLILLDFFEKKRVGINLSETIQEFPAGEEKLIDMRLFSRTTLIALQKGLDQSSGNIKKEFEHAEEIVSVLGPQMADLDNLIEPFGGQQQEIDQLASEIDLLEAIDKIAAGERQRKAENDQQAAIAAARLKSLRETVGAMAAPAHKN